MRVDGILLLYHHPLGPSAATIMEHVGAFARHSRFPVFALNTELGFPAALDELDFSVVVLHYSLFGHPPYALGQRFRRFLRRSPATLRIAFFQDEMHWCGERFSFIREERIDWVYTLLSPKHWPDVYEKHTPGARLFHTVPGYVSDELLALRRFARPRSERRIDVGYRGRQLAAHLGKGAQEKHLIGVRFAELAANSGLALDIDSSEEGRIYGDAWHGFLGNCRATLGVEAGTSVFDIHDEVRLAHDAWLRGPQVTPFEVESAALVARYEDKIFYRTVSPRHFEAAALDTAQILFPGAYSDIVDPKRHAVILEKDFGNVAEVIGILKEPGRLDAVVEAARRDLIDSGRWSYRRFLGDFDEALLQHGIRGVGGPQERAEVARRLDADRAQRSTVARARARAHALLRAQFPGREVVRRVARPLRPVWRWLLSRR